MAITDISSALIKEKVCEKVLEVERSGSCILYACRRRNKPLLLIALAEYNEWLYAKIVPEAGLPPDYWHCSHVYYSPYGVYAFSRNSSKLIEKIREKSRLADAIGILAEERSSVREAT